MVADLIRLLKSCSLEQRRDVAIRLAQTRTDEAVLELKNMVEGGVRERTPRTYRTFWLKRPIRYCSYDAEIGIEALGETGRKDVLDYLTHMYTPQIMDEDRESHPVQGIDVDHNYWKVEVHRYPNAPTMSLGYEIDLTNSTWGHEESNSPETIERERKEVPMRMRAHQIFRAAISKLEKQICPH